MRLAYLITTYPHVSHSFIRREIAALEGLGASISRFSIRASAAELVDPSDLLELRKTRCILKAGVLSFLVNVIRAALGHPWRFIQSLRLAIRLSRRSQRGLLRHIAYLLEACQLLHWLRCDDVQHLHAHFAGNSAAVAMLCNALGGLPYSFTAHGIEAFDAPESISLGEKVRRAEFIVAVCDHGRSQLHRWSSPADWPKLRVVRCGVDQSFLAHPRSEVWTAPRLVVVARLSAEKGHLVLLEAAGQLLMQGLEFELVFVGDGPMRAQIESRIRKLQLDSRVRVTGWGSAADVSERILSARALVLPSFAEGMPVVIMEAFALGRPVISTYVAGIPELVDKGVNGWLVPAGSAERLAAAMAEALKASVEELAAMGKRGAARVAELHDSAREAAKLIDLFRQAIGGGFPLDRSAIEPRPAGAFGVPMCSGGSP